MKKLSPNSHHLSVLKLWVGVAWATLFVCMAPSGFAQSANSPTKLTYDSFRAVSDRNIFNPNRYARGSVRSTTRTASTPASRVESFSLVGIMAYERGWFAFFDGTKSDYKHALQAGGKIGDYTVAAVTSELVTITESTNSIALKVGMQMRREGEGDWFLSEGGDSARKRIVSSRSHTRAATPSADPATGKDGEVMSGEPEIIVIDSGALPEESTSETGAAPADNGGMTDPVLLRLMQRRQQMNQ